MAEGEDREWAKIDLFSHLSGQVTGRKPSMVQMLLFFNQREAYNVLLLGTALRGSAFFSSILATLMLASAISQPCLRIRLSRGRPNY